MSSQLKYLVFFSFVKRKTGIRSNSYFGESGILLFFCWLTSLTYAQDTTKVFEGVTIRGVKDFNQETKYIKEDIEKLAPFDLGHLLQNSSGIALRDYGGMGGMKTLSIRGLGGEHTKLLVNGQTVTNAQNGQTDYGLIQVDNVESVHVSMGLNHNSLIPASAQAMGSAIEMNTFENIFSAHKHQIITSSTVGSFGQRELYGGYKNTNKNYFVSISGKYREAKGDYDYRIPLGDDFMEGTRGNNELQESFIAFGAGLKTVTDTLKQRYHFLKITSQVNWSAKQLPGAVILYSDFSDESLHTSSYRLGTDYTMLHKKYKARLFGGFNQHELHYMDPSYFNQTGFIDNYYKNLSALVGGSFNYQLNEQFALQAGTDTEKSFLYSNRIDFGVPQRLFSTTMIGLSHQNKYIETSAKIFHQYLHDENRLINHSNTFQRWNPQFQIITAEKLSKTFSFYTWAKKSMRAPSFNEMYYSQIGNTSLIPEDSWQFNLGAIFNKRIHSTQLSIKLNSYYNQVTNKIIAIPTQNIFIWSIANIGEVEVKGIDFETQLHHEFNISTQIKWRANVTYQEVMDVSNENSPTYRHQIIYTPKWNSSNTLSLYIKDFSFHQTTNFVGERYSLNQNIPSNRLDPFVVLDASLEYRIALKKSHKLKLQVGIRNIANSSYSYIRNFVMPGRNYFIKLTYALH